MWSKRATRTPSLGPNIGDPSLDLTGPFPMFCSRKGDRHRTGIQAFFCPLSVQLRVLVTHIERDNFARDEPALIGRSELGCDTRHRGVSTRRFVAPFVAWAVARTPHDIA